jgi:signal transduction histidine kinase
MRIRPKEENTEEKMGAQVLYVFLFTATVGVFFSSLFIVLFLVQGIEFPFPLPVVILVCTLLSGCCGILGLIMDKLFKRLGIKNEGLVRGLGFLSTVAAPFIFAFLLAWSTGYLDKLVAFLSDSIWFILLGCFFGGIAGVVEYFYAKLGGKVKHLSRQNRLLTDLAQKEQELAEKTKALAVMEERNRMARELHDSICQGIHGIIYSCHTLKKYLKATEIPSEAQSLVEHLEKTAGLTLSELRAMILELRPTLLENQGLAEALRVNAELFSWHQQVECELNLDYVAGLTSEQEIAVYRIAQEALANIRKHAGADRICLSLLESEERVELKIEDNGAGFDPENVKKGNGLLNMTTRAQDNRGVFRLQTAPGRGTVIHVEFSTD